ncbi:MAG: hypothetical protein ACRDLS_16110 [Solirubrobacteraceae bacterium]
MFPSDRIAPPLPVMFGRAAPSWIRHAYPDIVKPGVQFVPATVRSIDPVAKRVETDAGRFDGDVMVVGLGADLDIVDGVRRAWHPRREVCELDRERKVATLRDGGEMPFDLFLGVPAHRTPTAVVESGMTVDGWIPVDPLTLETAFPGVYAVADVAAVGTPRAGTFAQGHAACGRRANRLRVRRSVFGARSGRTVAGRGGTAAGERTCDDDISDRIRQALPWDGYGADSISRRRTIGSPPPCGDEVDPETTRGGPHSRRRAHAALRALRIRLDTAVQPSV